MLYKNTSGFTLIEVLVALGLLSVAMIGLASLTTQLAMSSHSIIKAQRASIDNLNQYTVIKIDASNALLNNIPIKDREEHYIDTNDDGNADTWTILTTEAKSLLNAPCRRVAFIQTNTAKQKVIVQ